MMKMKKVLLFILAFTVLSVNAVNAKEGFYAGGSATVNRVEIYIDCSDSTIKKTEPTVAVDLGYKFNFNSFTVTPELYFNVSNKVFKDLEEGAKYELKEFGGLNVKFGYDINEELNTFFLVGLSYMKGKLSIPPFTANNGTNWSRQDVNLKMKQPVMNLGLGAEYEVMDNLDANLTVAYSFGKSKEYIIPSYEDPCHWKYKNIRVSVGANYYLGF